MTALDRIRLTGLLREAPLRRGFLVEETEARARSSRAIGSWAQVAEGGARHTGGSALHRMLMVVVAVLTGGAVLAPAAVAGISVPPTTDHAIVARDIVPSGEYGSVPPPANADQQAQMYNALTPAFNNVTPTDLVNDFKPEPVGIAGAAKPLTI